jgi:hypothetical protein
MTRQVILSNKYLANGALSVQFEEQKLAAGVYFLRVDDGIGTKTLKFIVR